MQPDKYDILELILSVGQARNCYVQAIQEAKSHHYEECNELMRKGNEVYQKGHRIHQGLMQEEAGGEHVDISVLLTHAQDQLMSAENFKILCEEFVDMYRKMDELEAKLDRVSNR